jgi:hypothetical protein
MIFRTGGPGKTRTSDLRFRKPLLYPAELRDHLANVQPMYIPFCRDKKCRDDCDLPALCFGPGKVFDVRSNALPAHDEHRHSVTFPVFCSDTFVSPFLGHGVGNAAGP